MGREAPRCCAWPGIARATIGVVGATPDHQLADAAVAVARGDHGERAGVRRPATSAVRS